MKSINGMSPSFRRAACLSMILFASTLLAACSPKPQQVDDLAVAKLPIEQMHATNFLPLNADKPGTPVDVQRYLVPGKYTLVGYLSRHDGPSVRLEPRLVKLAQVRNDLAVRIVYVDRPGMQSIDWQSPVIQGMGLLTLPYFQIYDQSRNLRAKARPAYEQVTQWVGP